VGQRVVNAIDAVCGGLPAQADRVRRLFWRNGRFRSVCEDYRDAVEAMERFAAGDPARAEEFRQLAAELLLEAAAMLRGSNHDVH
jgi:hypothetical protein